jgi:hypothetical protein
VRSERNVYVLRAKYLEALPVLGNPPGITDQIGAIIHADAAESAQS